MNTVYAIAPTLTLRTSPASETFLEAFHRALIDYCNTSILRTASALRMTEPDSADVVTFFNRADSTYEAHFLEFLRRAKRGNSKILPIATTKDERLPPDLVKDKQSFDVTEQLRQRALKPDQIGTVATVFARQTLSILKPTLATEPMHLFLSHRRLDGEEITADFHHTLISTTQKAFRDLFDVRVGEDAQEIIEERLAESDAVIFLDTPKTGESPWITKELRLALNLQLPIVWIRLGLDEGRIPLKVIPAGAPHFSYPDLSPATEQVPAAQIELIVQKAFEIHHRDYVDRLLDEFGRLRDLAQDHEIKFDNVDPRRMIFSLALPRKNGRYRQRPLTHLIQLFGRTPTLQDVGQFSACAKDADYEPHPKHGAHYDSAILLAAIPSRASASFDEAGVHIDAIGDYVSEIERTVRPPKIKQKRLVISGAFADCEPEFQQNMTNAVHGIAETFLRAGLGLSFGAHPTFQFLLFDLAKRVRPDDHLSAIRMYISRFFATEAMVEEYSQGANVISTAAINGDRAASLTAMREAMIVDPEASAIVVIGGKTSRGGHIPGVDEEIELARKARLPVYLIGSVGGRSSELSSSLSLAEREALNGATETANVELASSLDYSRLAELILSASFR
ncbi:MAG TPA: TIR domain-containing protein [Silvibacterium sp.]|nr:TIR domain-containing protein [Silvibacterium sp.]